MIISEVYSKEKIKICTSETFVSILRISIVIGPIQAPLNLERDIPSNIPLIYPLPQIFVEQLNCVSFESPSFFLFFRIVFFVWERYEVNKLQHQLSTIHNNQDIT